MQERDNKRNMEKRPKQKAGRPRAAQAAELKQGKASKYPRRFYVVVRGWHTGIYSSLEEYRSQVLGYRGALSKSFHRYPDAVKWFRTELKKLRRVFYAVRRGWQTGIFKGEAEALRAVEGFAGAELKRFGTEKEAELWLAELGDPAAAEAYAVAMAAEKSLAKVTKAGKATRHGGAAEQKAESAAEPQEDIAGKNKACFYAVHRGWATGVFSQEENFRAAVDGFDGAEYSSFETEQEAKEWYKERRHCAEESEMSRQLAVILGALRVANDSDTELRITKVEKVEAEPAPALPVQRPQERFARFTGVQFDRSLWQSLTAEECLRFAKGFRVRLEHLARTLSGEVRAAGNSLKLIRRSGKVVLKRRLGKKRVSLSLCGGIITLLRVSTHDRQMHDILTRGERCAGYVFYKTEDFLARLEAFAALPEGERPGFTSFICDARHFVYDAQQAAVIENEAQMKNISLVGSAGAGKSLVGLACLAKELLTNEQDCIYLTLSQNLVYTLGYEYERGLGEGEGSASRLRLVTTFDFLRQEAQRLYPDIPGRAYLDAAGSWRAFEEFWRDEVDWEAFWDHGAPDFALRTEEATRLSVWRELHGFLKGAVPTRLSFREPLQVPELLSETDYRNFLAQEKKRSAGEKSERWIRRLFQTAKHYQSWLTRRGLYDDNDLARLLLTGKAAAPVYGAAFLDECQDLTQVQLLALFRLLRGTRLKRLASDRCQMVQPTYFNEGQMRTLANEYERAQGQAVEDILPRYLYHNYRATRSLIRLQNYLIGLFQVGGVLSLKAEELAPIREPLYAQRGSRPVWIAAGEENRRLLAKLWQETEAGALELLVARQESRNESFGEMEGASADIIGCKGMEYPAVLLYNLLSDLRFDAALAWKYFYVGATRSHRVLLIYEEAEKSEGIGDFLERAESIGLLERCEDLSARRGDGERWLDYLAAQLRAENVAERLETAESALSYGQYRLAYSIWQAVGAPEELLHYTQGKIAEDEGDYPRALELYAGLPEEWQSRGRTRRNSVDTLLGRTDIAGREFVAAWLLRHGDKPGSLLPEAKKAWREKFGAAVKEDGFYLALQNAAGSYPCAEAALKEWYLESLCGLRNWKPGVMR